MESRQSVILCLVYAAFLILGAVMFMFLEYEVIEKSETNEPPEWTHLKDLVLVEQNVDQEKLLTLATWLPKACPALSNYTIQRLISSESARDGVNEVEVICPHLHEENVTIEIIYPWSFIDALYFSMTVSTTIGYGAACPSQTGGRVMCMVYALVGIPLTGILLAWTSEFFGEQLFKLFKSKFSTEKQHSRKVIALATIFYIACGFVVFIFVPGAIFTAIEKDWTYLEGIYYAFITLTTIGFGDFVTGNTVTGAWLYGYQICVILWIMIGLGYWVMVANFITKALKSKRLQSSVLRSAEEMKKIMQQMGIKHHDPRFLRQHSKATLNFMLQLSNIIAVQGGMESGSGSIASDTPDAPNTSASTNTTTVNTTSTTKTTPQVSPLTIPGIAALFGPAMSPTSPLSQLMGPMGSRSENGGRKCTEEFTAVSVRYKS